MKIHTRTYIEFSFIFLFLGITASFAQDQEANKSPAYKEKYKFNGVPLILYSAFDAQIVQVFQLMRDANAGKAVAQHELAVRYLFGRGLPPDTPKAVYWMMKAAQQDLPLAHYNIGIMHIQGIGVPWNPFEAFQHFQSAADEEIPEALFMMGVMYSEDFVVPRSWPKSFSYIKRSAELGMSDAIDALKELRHRGVDSVEAEVKTASSKKKQLNNGTAQAARSDTTTQLVFIDFHTDTTSVTDDTTLVREAYQQLNVAQKENPAEEREKVEIDSAKRSILLTAADIGNPEALCVLGRCYEKGWSVKKDQIIAAEYYFRAIRAESFRAPALLWRLMNTEHFSHELESRTTKKDPDALFVWAGLTAIDFAKLLNGEQALKILKHNAEEGHVLSMVELGLCYFNGRWVPQDKIEASRWWMRASKEGSTDAKFRLAMLNVAGEIHSDPPDSTFAFLQALTRQGSLVANAGVGLCYEVGYCVPQNKGEAYRIYHGALHRGSETSYRSLQRMHDEIRPGDPEFQVNN